MNDSRFVSSRRHFLAGAAGAVSSLSLTNTSRGSTDTGRGKITAARVGSPTTIPDNYGDTWAVAWADDGNLYVPSNDTLGFAIPEFLDEKKIRAFPPDPRGFAKLLTDEQKAEFHYSPIAFSRLDGEDPVGLRGTTVNRMQDYVVQDGYDQYMYPERYKSAADGRTWKSSGCTFIDGALYWAIARDRLERGAETIPGVRQVTSDASIIKSIDRGKTWLRTAQENMSEPMFPGSYFTAPYFINYGKGGKPVDRSDRYVYAVSNNGFWDNGDSLILGRVARGKIAHLRGTDWEFFTGGDGLLDKNWSPQVTLAAPILSSPGKIGETGPIYLPDRQCYLLISWYYPAGSGWIQGASSKTTWDFYEAPTPWGVWSLIGSHTWAPQGYYCPTVCPKFQSADRVYVLTAGDFKTWWDFYHLTVVPVDLV